jgi:glycine hydroxymethyltransferase
LEKKMVDYLFRGSIAELDSDLATLLDIEAERQFRKLILIPSESSAPLAVRAALSSAFQNIYAEGYPDEETRRMTQEEILNYDKQLTDFRRFSDPRYYKGVEYADIVEALARRRCAELFAVNGYQADDIYVNIQPLSGAPANNAVYHALINPGDTILGMNLLHGGHLSHGSSVNRSGKYYHAVHYGIDADSQQIDYAAVREIAKQCQPKIIVAGYSSYPWVADWVKFREIADSVGAYLLTDIAHVAGLVAAGVYPSPIGLADVITFTTHKSLCGPRGACILTTNPALVHKIDRAVFPGEQGGPHVNTFAAMALAFKLARTDQFRKLQAQIVKNCVAFTERFKELGFQIPFGGTNTHLMNLDVSTITGSDGAGLSGDQAARILDIAGIVVNRNTIPGDLSAVDPSGIRMGTPWVTQRGFKDKDMRKLADIIAELLSSAQPFYLLGRKGKVRKAKVDFNILENAKIKVRDMAINAGVDFNTGLHDYPHFYYLDDQPVEQGGWSSFVVRGERVRQFLNFALSCDLGLLDEGATSPTCIYTPSGTIEGSLSYTSTQEYKLNVPKNRASLVAAWLRDLSDGYIGFDINTKDDLQLPSRLPGAVVVKPTGSKPETVKFSDEQVSETGHGTSKPFYIGIPLYKGKALSKFQWEEKEGELRRTPLNELHKQLGAKLIPFAGWEMPVWYSSVLEEHNATRQAAGLFDVAHMGVYQAEGADAAAFLDSVCSNDIGGLAVGESCYTHFLSPDAQVIDDTLVYHWSREMYLVVVNASNDDKDWAWLTSVREGMVLIDNLRPWSKAFGRKVILRNLRDPKEGQDMRVDIALQGPRSREILLKLGADGATEKKIMAMTRTQVCKVKLGGFDLILSRTGYTGEKMAFECFVHPEKAADLFETLLQAGEPLGLKPVGLGARDSLRTEAGLPLYGHEMGLGSGKMGNPDLGVSEAGFGSYVKSHKPWFIGREAFLVKEAKRKGIVARFRFSDKGVRMAHPGDPVLDKRGFVTGWVTSCAADSAGYLTGQAFVDLKDADEGTHLFIYQGAPDKSSRAPSELSCKDRVTLPGEATIVSRFE